MSNADAQDSDSKKNIKKKKKDEQTATIASRGKPTGFGKRRWTKEAEYEYKQMVGSSEEIVDLKTFIKLYNEDKGYHPGRPPRIFVRQNDDNTSFKFMSTDFVYKTTIKTVELSQMNVQIALSNLGNNIFML